MLLPLTSLPSRGGLAGLPVRVVQRGLSEAARQDLMLPPLTSPPQGVA